MVFASITTPGRKKIVAKSVIADDHQDGNWNFAGEVCRKYGPGGRKWRL
jgi:hypothetical protein